MEEADKSLDLIVIICTYNVKDKVLENIVSVKAQKTNLNFKILLVDSGSTDGTLAAVKAQHPDVLTHDCHKNVGSAAARNAGMKLFPDLAALVLDSDLVLEENAMDAMYVQLGHNVGQVVGHLYSVDGSTQCTCFRKPTLLSLAARLFYFSDMLPECCQEKYSNEDLKKPLLPFWSSGGFTLQSKEAIQRVGLRDEDFFVYGEDVEHSHRISESGMKIVYTPLARALHYGSSSTRQNVESCREDVYRGLLLYWEKRHTQKYIFAWALIVLRLVVAALVLLLTPTPKHLKSAMSHINVLFKVFFFQF